MYPICPCVRGSEGPARRDRCDIATYGLRSLLSLRTGAACAAPAAVLLVRASKPAVEHVPATLHTRCAALT